MKFIKKAFIESLLFAAIILFSLSITTPVFADSGTPTSEPGQVQAETIYEDGQPEDSDQLVESSYGEVSEAGEANLPAETQTEPEGENNTSTQDVTTPTETQTDSEVNQTPQSPAEDNEETQSESDIDLAELSVSLSDADLQLVNGEEESLPMGSEAVVESAIAADPYFYVGTTKYSFTHADCDPDTAGDQACSNPIQATLDYIRSHGIVPTNRMIYVEDATYDEDVTLDGTTSSSLSQLKGLIGQSTTGTILNGNLWIGGTTSGFTFSNFTVNGQVYFDGNIGTLSITDVTQSNSTDAGVVVINQNGSVSLTRVNATNNANSGAVIDNTISTGAVTITESTFDGNGTASGAGDYYAGLEVYNRSTVTLNGVSASGNNGDGAVVDGFKTLTVRNSMFNYNDHDPDLAHSGYGLDVHTLQAGTINLDTVVALNNDDDGIRLLTYGNATLKYVTAEGNGWNGLRICGITGGDNDCSQARAVNVAISNSSFSGNGESGIAIADRGTVTLTEVFSGDNVDYGILIQSIGNVTLNSVSAQSNTYGAFINTAIEGGKGNVSILNSKGSNDYSDNMQGLQILARGSISLAGVYVGRNDEWGAILDNTSGTSAVTVKSTYFSDNDWFGAEIWSNGAVTVQGGANNNGQDLDDLPFDSHGGGLYINNYAALKAVPVTLTWGWFDNNQGGDGLNVDSRGNISLTDISANNNAYMGANLHNAGTGTGTISVKASKLTDKRDMNDNGVFGLYAISNNSITVLNMNFNGNDIGGALLDNADGVKKAVSLTNVDFYGNTGDGLNVYASGAVTITNINAAWNNGDGVYIDNQDGAGNVSINRTEKKWHNYLSENGLSGLRIYANGAVSLNKVMANWNGWDADPDEYAYGAFIDNCRAVLVEGDLVCTVAGGTVSIKGTSDWQASFSNNKSSGLAVFSPNAISLTYVEANENGQYGDYGAGIYLGNDYLGRTAGVTLSHTVSNANNGSGLTVWSNGPISATYLYSGDNAGIGASLNNLTDVKISPVTVKYVYTGDNLYDGLSIHSSGAINVSVIESNNNGRYGATLFNWNTASIQTVTVSDGQFDNNTDGDGLEIITRGNVKLSNVTANNNDVVNGSLYVSGSYGVAVEEQIRDYDNAGDMVDYWYLNLATDVDFTLWLQSYEFTPVLTLYRYNDSTGDWDYLLSDSDFGDGDGIASFSYLLLASEEYRVSVSSPDADQTGGYILDIGYDGSTPYTDNGEGGNGIYVFTETGSLTINNPANATSYNNNASTGLYTMAGNSITLTNVFANENGNLGASLYIMNGSGAITINGWANGFNNNREVGLDVSNGGVISLTNLDAYGNGNTGVSLYNYRGTGDVKILTNRSNWRNSFSGNAGHGLIVGTRGNVTINNVVANDNAWYGTEIYNWDGYGPLSVKTAKITNSEFSNNGFHGLLVMNYGPITLDLVTGNDNAGDGINLDNTSNALGQAVTATRIQTSFNDSNGLSIYTNGKVILDGLLAMYNGGDGVYVSNQYAGSVGTVTLTNKKGTNFFLSNGGNGLNIYSNKAITVSGIETKQNSFNGVRLVSLGGIISLSNAVVNRNDDAGIYVQSTGFDVILNAVKSFMNGLDYGFQGLFADIVGGNLRLINSSFYGNGTFGVYAQLDSLARWLVSGSTFFGNGQYTPSANYLIVY